MRARTATVRRGTLGDADTLAWIEVVSRGAYFRRVPAVTDTTPRPGREQVAGWRARLVAPSPATVLLAEVAGEAVGSIALAVTDDPETCRMEQFWVLPHLWSRGIGRLLHEHTVAYAVRAGCRELVTWVWDINPRGLRFAVRAGWVNDGRWMPGPANSQFVGMVMRLPESEGS